MSTADITGPANTRFHTKLWSPPASTPVVATLLFVHGFVEHIERYDHAFPRFAEKGIAVFGYDQRGFGRTATFTSSKSNGVTSWAQQLEDLEFFLKHARSLHPETPLFLFGHSMGGGLSLAFPTRVPPSSLVSSLSGVMASSPLLRQAKGVKAPGFIVRAGGLLGKLSGALTLKATVKAEDVTRDVAVQKAYASDPLCIQVGTFRGVSDMLLGGESLMTSGYQAWPSSLPLLIVHGDADKVTDCSASAEFVEKVTKRGAKDASFKAFEGYYHEMHNEPDNDKYIELDFLRSWLLNHLSPSPSSPSAAGGRTSVSSAFDPTKPENVAAAAAGVTAAPTITVSQPTPSLSVDEAEGEARSKL